MAIKTIRFTGPFTDEDIAAFAALLRRIDDANPGSLYAMSFTDPDRSMDEAADLMERMLPPLQKRLTVFARAAYRDKNYPRRCCDWCGVAYRGPAVYCSFDCAAADAI